MKERILTYMEYVDKILDKNDSGLNYEEFAQEHKVQLSFFMHERLVHLLVTLCFAVLAFSTFFLMYLEFSLGLFALFVSVMILLVPYIMHYYLLENGVQRMYKQYDVLQKKVLEEKRMNRYAKFK